jgi:hypothetical protein
MSNAQSIERSVIGSAGGYASAGSVQLSWTAGETVTATATAGSVMLTQGFQQAEQTPNSVTPIDLSSVIRLYPNPSAGIFQLGYKTNSPSNASDFSAHVFDATGKMVANISRIDLASGSSDLDLSALPGGMYTLRMLSNQNAAGTFKLTIIK